MKEYVITGGAGFIGSNLADYYLSRGHRVVLVDNFSRYGSAANAEWLTRSHGELLTVCRIDVCNNESSALARVVERADAVFHFAAQVAVTSAVACPRADLEANILGTFNVLEAVRQTGGKAAVLYSSTNKVYGKMADIETREAALRYVSVNCPGGIGEDRPLDFHSPYGCSKGAADQYVLDYARTYGLTTVVFRQSCIYGPRQFGIEDQGWIAWFAIRALQGLPMTVYGDGKQVRDALYVEDLVAAYDAAVNSLDRISGEVYNIGGGPGNTLSLLELLLLLEAELGSAPEHSFEDWRTGDQRIFVSDIGKAQRDFGWAPKVSVQEGVSRLIAWLTKNKHLFSTTRSAAIA